MPASEVFIDFFFPEKLANLRLLAHYNPAQSSTRSTDQWRKIHYTMRGPSYSTVQNNDVETHHDN